MRSFSDIKKAIYDAVNGESGIECMWDRQDSPITDKPFFSLGLRSFRKVGRDVLIGPDEDGEYTMIGNRDFTLEIRGFGPGVVEATLELQIALERPEAHEALSDEGVIIYDLDQPIIDISDLDRSQPEERSSWDLLLRTDSEVTKVPAGIIETVNIDETLVQEGKPSIDRELTIESVPPD